MDKKSRETKYMNKKRTLVLISIFVVLAMIVGLSIFIYKTFLQDIKSPEAFQKYIQSFGWTGRFVFLAIQFLQVFIAFIPGEPLEVAAGYIFGALEGTLLCLAGTVIASTLVFLLTRKFGVKLVEIFVSREKINQLRFINDEKKLKRTLFLIFFIPGTPKDLLTYFAGLTKISLLQFLVISSIARIPSIVTSTLSGGFLGENQFLTSAIIFAATAVLSGVGILIYNRIIKFKEKKEDKHISKTDK